MPDSPDERWYYNDWTDEDFEELKTYLRYNPEENFENSDEYLSPEEDFSCSSEEDENTDDTTDENTDETTDENTDETTDEDTDETDDFGFG